MNKTIFKQLETIWHKGTRGLLSAGLASTMLVWGGTPVQLEPTRDADLHADRVIRTTAKAHPVAPAPSREAVRFSWPIERETEIDLNYRSHEATSKGFRLLVRGEDFRNGIALPLETSRAVIAINAVGEDRVALREAAIDPHDVTLVAKNGTVFRGAEGLEKLAALEDLQNARKQQMPVATTMFKLAGQVGSGEVMLFADNMNHDRQDRYVIQVLEKHSDVALGLRTGRDTYLPGEPIALQADWLSDTSTLTTVSLEGRIVSPTGKVHPLRFDARNQLSPFTLSEREAAIAGLWRVEVTAIGDDGVRKVRRDVATAFALTEPTARFSGKAEVSLTKNALVAGLEVEVGSAGRFEARGILFGTDATGAMVPVAVAHAADWFQPGQRLLALHFDGETLEQAAVGAPFEVRDLRLIHQDRLGLLHRQAQALRVEAID